LYYDVILIVFQINCTLYWYKTHGILCNLRVYTLSYYKQMYHINECGYLTVDM